MVCRLALEGRSIATLQLGIPLVRPMGFVGYHAAVRGDTLSPSAGAQLEAS